MWPFESNHKSSHISSSWINYESNLFINLGMHVFYAICKTAVISLVSINLTLVQSQCVQLDFLHHHVKFHPDQMKVRDKMKPIGLALR